MWNHLAKALPLLVYPLGMVCVLLGAALLIGSRSRLRAWLIGISIAILWLSGNRLVSMLALRSLEYRYLPRDPVPQAEAIVVLGGSTRTQSYPRPLHEVNEAGDRLIYAAHLYREGHAPLILLSGGTAVWSGPGRISEAEAMASLITTMGVPQDALMLEKTSANTYENALESAKILREHGIDTVLLVTSALHMPRAYGVFEATGLTAIPAPVDYLFTQEEWDYFTEPRLGIQIYNLLPDARELHLTTQVLKEYLGMIMYRLRGWM